MGTFDILNLRINGYDFHVNLMAGKEAWTDRQGQEGLRHLGRAAPAPPGGRARPHLAGGRAVAAAEEGGMYLLGLFVGQQFSDAEQDDLDFFPFPEIDSEHRARTRSTPRSTGS